MKLHYDVLNEAVHAAADVFDKAGLDMSSFDREQLNDYLTNYLNDRGEVEMTDDCLEDGAGHIEDCELGDNWKACPACVEAHNGTCSASERIDG